MYFIVPELGDLRQVVHGGEEFYDGAEGGSVGLVESLNDGLVELIDLGGV